MTTTLTRNKADAHRVTGASMAPERYKMSTLSIVGVLALLIGFGVGWLVFRDTGVNVPANVETLIDDYSAAWIANDGDAAVAFMENGAYFYSDALPEGLTGEALADAIDITPTWIVSQLEITAVEGDGPWLVITRGEGTSGDFSVSHIADRGGELKILNHIWLDD